jgi:peptidoglycan/LPS O-acetylase OafA/YrhL
MQSNSKLVAEAVFASHLPRPGCRCTALTLAGVGLIGLSLFMVTKNTPFPGPMTLLPVVGTVAVIYAGQGSGSFLTRILGTPFLVYLGDISYSWYLWHWPFVVFASVMVGKGRQYWPRIKTAFANRSARRKPPIRRPYSGLSGWVICGAVLRTVFPILQLQEHSTVHNRQSI